MSTTARTIFGVDFSGARLAGEKIWIARAQIHGAKLVVEQLQRADELPGSSVERAEALAALVEALRDGAGAVAGLDFPFSLAASSLGDTPYAEFLTATAEFGDADTFRLAFTDARRQTDIDAKTPFSPLNHRLYRQTFHGIRDVLRPLVASGARVLPMMQAEPDALWLVEICPASTLKREKLYLSYKGKSELQHANRALILREIKARFGVETPGAMDERMLADTEGDALDAVLAAVATNRALQAGTFRVQAGTSSVQAQTERVEGRVYY